MKVSYRSDLKPAKKERYACGSRAPHKVEVVEVVLVLVVVVEVLDETVVLLPDDALVQVGLEYVVGWPVELLVAEEGLAGVGVDQ